MVSLLTTLLTPYVRIFKHFLRCFCKFRLMEKLLKIISDFLRKLGLPLITPEPLK
jgi:hypothetical protein